MKGHRTERVADRVRDVLARALREGIRDPRVGFVTITDVELSTDLRHARVFVSLIGDDVEERLRVLRGATSFLRRAVAAEAGLRHAPSLRIELDESSDRAESVERILREVGPPDDDPQ